MTREEVIAAVEELSAPLGPLGEFTWDIMIGQYTMDEWIAQAPPETLDVLVSLITSPPDHVPPRGSVQKDFIRNDFHEDLAWLTGAWATRDANAFWQKIGPLLLSPEHRWGALNAVLFADPGEELKWLLPLVEDLDNIPAEEQLMVLAAVSLVDTPEAQACLEEWRERRVVGTEFQVRLVAVLTRRRGTPLNYGYIPPGH